MASKRAIKALRDLKEAIRTNGAAWPGGYPLFAVLDDGEALSIKACKELFKELIWSTLRNMEDGLTVVAIDINYECPDLFCVHSGDRIESAYAEPEIGEQMQFRFMRVNA